MELRVERHRLESALSNAATDERVDLGAALRSTFPDGRERRLLPRVFPTARGASDGGGAVVVLSDVTELARLGELRAEHVAVASHELRTPVTTLRMSPTPSSTRRAEGGRRCRCARPRGARAARFRPGRRVGPSVGRNCSRFGPRKLSECDLREAGRAGRRAERGAAQIHRLLDRRGV